MVERIGRCWRVLATGLCFAVFGLGGLLLRVLVFPALRFAVRSPERQATLARHLIRWTFRVFLGLMQALGVLSFEVRGLAKLQRRGLLILANHPTLIDVVFLIAFVERADCIVKAALARNSFTRGPVRAAGYVCNDSGPGMVEDCIASLRAGNNLIVFPEGTRTPRDGSAACWQRGGAHVALRSGVDVTPVRIAVTPPVLRKGDPWYRVPVRRSHFVFDIGDDISVAAFVEGSPNEALAARHLTDHLAHTLTSPETFRAAA